MAEYIQQSIENNRSGAEKGIILGKTTEQYFSSSESKKIALQSEIDNVFVTSVK